MAGSVSASTPKKPLKYQLRIKARGYATFESRIFRSSEGQVRYDIELTKTDEPQGPVISGVVQAPGRHTAPGR